MQIQNYLKTKIINHNWKVHIEKCTFQQINPDKYEKTNHLFPAACEIIPGAVYAHISLIN